MKKEGKVNWGKGIPVHQAYSAVESKLILDIVDCELALAAELLLAQLSKRNITRKYHKTIKIDKFTLYFKISYIYFEVLRKEESLKTYPAIQMALAKEAKNTMRFF